MKIEIAFVFVHFCFFFLVYGMLILVHTSSLDVTEHKTEKRKNPILSCCRNMLDML